MKKTLNPKDPIRNEVASCKADRVPQSELAMNKNFMKNLQGCRFDFTNYPDAIPEECFLYFGDRSNAETGLTQKEALLSQYFLNKHFKKAFYRIRNRP